MVGQNDTDQTHPNLHPHTGSDQPYRNKHTQMCTPLLGMTTLWTFRKPAEDCFKGQCQFDFMGAGIFPKRAKPVRNLTVRYEFLGGICPDNLVSKHCQHNTFPDCYFNHRRHNSIAEGVIALFLPCCHEVLRKYH